MFGGEQWVREQKVFADGWVSDPRTDRWAALPPLPTPRHGLGAAMVGNRIHVIGGGTRVGGDAARAVQEVWRWRRRAERGGAASQGLPQPPPTCHMPPARTKFPAPRW